MLPPTSPATPAGITKIKAKLTMNKEEIKAKLTELGIEFDADASRADLQALLPEGKNTSDDEIIVKDPQDLRPVALPLVITLPKDASNAQIAFAKILNAYAYQNPTKWAIKKDKLVAQLKALKNAPDPATDIDRGLKVAGSAKLPV